MMNPIDATGYCPTTDDVPEERLPAFPGPRYADGVKTSPPPNPFYAPPHAASGTADPLGMMLNAIDAIDPQGLVDAFNNGQIPPGAFKGSSGRALMAKLESLKSQIDNFMEFVSRWQKKNDDTQGAIIRNI